MHEKRGVPSRGSQVNCGPLLIKISLAKNFIHALN